MVTGMGSGLITNTQKIEEILHKVQNDPTLSSQ
jgi:hypothetical protein